MLSLFSKRHFLFVPGQYDRRGSLPLLSNIHDGPTMVLWSTGPKFPALSSCLSYLLIFLGWRLREIFVGPRSTS